MKTIRKTYEIKAPVAKVWEALVDPKAIEGWGAGPAKMNDRVGSKFSLWGGDIHGKNLKVVANKELIQEWYGGDWDRPSKSCFRLHTHNGGTKLEFIHEDVPDHAAKDIDQGWDDYYLGPIKEYLEN